MLVYQRLSHIHHRSPHEFPVDGIPHLPRPPPTRRLKARGPFLFDDHLLALLRSIDDLKPPSDSCCFSMVNWYIWYICYMMKRHIASFLEFKKWVYNPTYGRAGTTSWNTVTIFHQKIRSVFHNIQRRPSKKKRWVPKQARSHQILRPGQWHAARRRQNGHFSWPETVSQTKTWIAFDSI